MALKTDFILYFRDQLWKGSIELWNQDSNVTSRKIKPRLGSMCSRTLPEISTIVSIVRLGWSQVRWPIRMRIRFVRDYMDRNTIFILATLRKATKYESQKLKISIQRVMLKVSIVGCSDFVLKFLFRLVRYNLYDNKLSKEFRCLLLHAAESRWR